MAPEDREARKHVDQTLGAKEIDASAQKIAHAGPANVQQPGRLQLCQFLRGDGLLELNHQVGTDEQALRSPAENSRSRNRLPVDGVTFSLCLPRMVGPRRQGR